MDRNTIIGLVLIFLIIAGFSWWNRPSKEQLEEQQRVRDSLEQVELARVQREAELKALEELQQNEVKDSTATQEALTAAYGDFAAAAEGSDSLVTIENEKVRVKVSTKGGRVCYAELKEYHTYDSLPLVLFQGDESELGFTFLSSKNRVLNSSDFYFEPTLEQTDSLTTLVMRLTLGEDKYLEFAYQLPKDSYKLDFTITAHNIQEELDNGSNTLEMHWRSKLKQQEKGRKFESRYATLNYKYAGDDVERLNENKDDHKRATGKVRWIGFKDQYFSTVLMAEQAFTSTELESVVEKDARYLKDYKADASVAFDPKGAKPSKLSYIFIPNKYSTLRAYDRMIEEQTGEDIELRRLLPLGWALFRWVSEYFIIPIFNFIGRYVSNMGIVILLLTLVVKLVIFPFTFKSYMSTAKMRVLKPQIDEINAKYPADKAMERQQATMALYRRVGVSPMGGCLPMLLQMPILFAMFMFIPTCIELRQESFLWAKDLASYDAIVSWNVYIPFITKYFGNHISLFCLLMTVTNIVYTYLNMQTQNTGDANQMKLMKWMMYLMPIMFMFIFNDYASGLSYYYFISLLITIVQTYLCRLFVDEEKLLKKLEENKNKPVKKSGFMARLEAAQRAQQKAMREQAKRKK